VTVDDYLRRAASATQPLTPQARATVPIVDFGEALVSINVACPLVRVRVRVAARLEYIGRHELLAREGVCIRLKAMAEALAPKYEIVVFDAHRPLEYQRRRYEQVRAQVAAESPELTEQELRDRVDQWVAEPNEDPRCPPPHSTGAALDMLLASPDGELDFGSNPGNYSSEHAERHFTNVFGLAEHVLQNRRLLLTAALEAGFANHPAEWWHYSYGDQEWCLHTRRAEVALYGRV
jgi:D-alanyl-D-alanine dipeptidase